MSLDRRGQSEVLQMQFETRLLLEPACGCRVWGLGFRFWGLGSGVRVSGCGVWGSEFRVQGLRLQDQSVGVRL